MSSTLKKIILLCLLSEFSNGTHHIQNNQGGRDYYVAYHGGQEAFKVDRFNLQQNNQVKDTQIMVVYIIREINTGK